MEKLIAEVAKLLIEHFPGERNTVDLEESVPNEKIGGSVVAAQFSGMEQIDRQRAVRDVLKLHLSYNDYLNVGFVLTFTPQEVAAMEDVAVAA